VAESIVLYEAYTPTPVEAAASYDEGTIADGADSAPRQFWVKNTSDGSESLTLQAAREAVGTNDGIDLLQLAADDSGAPGTWGTAAVALGTLAVNGVATFWVRYHVPAATTQIGNPRQCNVVIQKV